MYLNSNLHFIPTPHIKINSEQYSHFWPNTHSFLEFDSKNHRPFFINFFYKEKERFGQLLNLCFTEDNMT